MQRRIPPLPFVVLSELEHVVPVPFGGGLRLFGDDTSLRNRLKLTWSLIGPTATHLRYDVIR